MNYLQFKLSRALFRRQKSNRMLFWITKMYRNIIPPCYGTTTPLVQTHTNIQLHVVSHLIFQVTYCLLACVYYTVSMLCTVATSESPFCFEFSGHYFGHFISIIIVQKPIISLLYCAVYTHVCININI